MLKVNTNQNFHYSLKGKREHGFNLVSVLLLNLLPLVEVEHKYVPMAHKRAWLSACSSQAADSADIAALFDSAASCQVHFIL